MKKEKLIPTSNVVNSDLNSELIPDNIKLALQISDRKKRSAELIIAYKELAYQNQEKEKRAAELVIANKELAFQNQEKEKRAAELVIANEELVFQNKEKEKRAAELAIANKELAFQNQEKEKRAAELVIANEELVFQNNEKEKRAAELVIANIELAYQNTEREKRAAELIKTNKELEAFTFISSHDLQEPLRKIQTFSNRIINEEYQNLSDQGKHYCERIENSALHLQTIINDLLAYSRTNEIEKKFEKKNLNILLREVKIALKEELQEKSATFVISELGDAYIIPFQFRQLFQNLIANSLKFCKPGHAPNITIKSRKINQDEAKSINLPLQTDYCHISMRDDGIGFESRYNEKIFIIFQRLHSKNDYQGTGIGLTIVKKIIENHNGVIRASGELDKGATFDIYIPTSQHF